jgi:hypothetical protein
VAPAVADAIESAIPAVLHSIEDIAPPVMEMVDTAIPAVVDTIQSVVPVVANAVAEVPTVVMDAVKPPARTSAASAPAPMPEDSRPAAPAFVTETMAQLYLSQGHRSEALDIYRQLLESRPNDAELRARYETIASARPAQPAEQAAAHASSGSAARRFGGGGPSIRSILRQLFGIHGSAAPSIAASGPTPGEVGSVDMLFSNEVVGDGLDPLAVAFDGGFVASRGTLDELFLAS